jgi:hypothetical protein
VHTIGLTSPTTKGADVRRIQSLLKTNWTHRDFLLGDIDGAFGPQTSRACIRAKYWLGYPTNEQKPFAGDQLVHYLTVQDALPLIYRGRRAARLKAAQEKPLRLKALERAEKTLGIKESPAGSNRCIFTDRWNIIGPWCCMAVSLWYLDAGSKAFTLGTNWAYVPAFMQAAELGVNGLAMIPASMAQPGDCVCFDWDQGGLADHAGLLRSGVHADGTFQTIEGNTAAGNDSNGGEVQHRDRVLGNVARYHGAPAFIRVSR